MNDTVLSVGGFLALFNGVVPRFEAEYRDWHASEHVPERLSLPGFRSAVRFEAEPGTEPRYFTLYDLMGPEVLATDAYKAVVASPTPRSRALRPYITDFARFPCAAISAFGSMDCAFAATAILPAVPKVAAGDGVAFRLGMLESELLDFPLGRMPEVASGAVVAIAAADARAAIDCLLRDWAGDATRIGVFRRIER